MTYEMALQDARYDGIVEGEERGRTAGIAIGIAEGEERGREEERIANARNFLAMGLSVEQVAQGTRLPLEQVRALADSQ